MPLSDHPGDIINECANKLALITTLLCNVSPSTSTHMPQNAIDGLFSILIAIEFDLRGLEDRICAKPQEV